MVREVNGNVKEGTRVVKIFRNEFSKNHGIKIFSI